MTIGHQLLLRGTEVKFLIAGPKRLLMEPGAVGVKESKE
jgi:hypothetical protein